MSAGWESTAHIYGTDGESSAFERLARQDFGLLVQIGACTGHALHEVVNINLNTLIAVMQEQSVLLGDCEDLITTMESGLETLFAVRERNTMLLAAEREMTCRS